MWDLIGKAAVFFIVGRLLFSIGKGLYSLLFAHILFLGVKFMKTGKWAVVTGATDGIGKEYAMQLARKGMNIVLISRTLSKLEDVAKEIKAKYPVETKVIAADYTRMDIYDNIRNQLSAMDIGVLVNNVGMSYEYPEYLHKVPSVEKVLDTLTIINMQSVNRMTLIVLPGMIERKRGVIINISSLSSITNAPFLTAYSATKAYVECFSKSLDLELTGTGVIVQCVLPGFVTTKLSGMKRSSLTVPNPQQFVKQALATVGVEKRTGGYYSHKLQIYFIEFAENYLPGFMMRHVVYTTMKGVRAKYLRRLENKKD